MNRKALPVLAFAMALSFVSCNKDEDDTQPGNNSGNQRTCYVQKIKQDDTGGQPILSDELIYDSNLRLSRINYYDQNGQTNSYYEYTYNSAGQVVKQEYFSNGTGQYYDEFEYNSQGRLIKILEFDRDVASGTFTQYGYETFEYNSANQVIKENDYQFTGELESSTTYEYTNGNVTRTLYYDNTPDGLALTRSEVMEYDDKRNPYKQFGVAIMDEEALSNNNPVKITNRDGNNKVDQNESYQIVYEYNSDGYPTKQTFTSFDNSETEVRELEFACP